MSTTNESVSITSLTNDKMLIFEPEFAIFNKIRTVMCRNNPCTRGSRCTFAHSTSEHRRSLCMYHFNKGCTKSASMCIHSHSDAEFEKSIVDYKKWKNPSPKVSPKKPTDEELIKEFGEFKISLEESESDDDGEYEDETDKKMGAVVKSSFKRPYEVLSISNSESAFTPTKEYIEKSGIEPLVPLEDWEKADKVDDSNKEPKTTNPFENYPNSDIYTLVYNQQVMMMTMMNQIQELQAKVESLMRKD